LILFIIISHIFWAPTDIDVLLDLIKLISLAGSNFGEGINQFAYLLVFQTKPITPSIFRIFIVKSKSKITRIIRLTIYPLNNNSYLESLFKG
jgi:hypothetical protein